MTQGEKAMSMSKKGGRSRVVIEGVEPEIDCGEFPIKRIAGEKVVVEADAFVDGHDALSLTLLHRREDQGAWIESPMQPLVNDRWRGEFTVPAPGRYLYTLQGWLDRFLTWRKDLRKRVSAGQNVSVDLQIGAALVEEAAA